MKSCSLPLHALLLILGISASLSLQADQNGYYRWTDENGTVQSSDHPPKGIESEFIKFTSPQGSSSSKNKKNTDQAQSTPKIYSEMEVVIEKDPELCKQAQNNLKALESARIRITEPDGSKRILTADEKELQQDNARKFIKIHC